MIDYSDDELVKFETAKKLESAGYDKECIYVYAYTEDGKHSEPYQYGGVKTHGIKLKNFKTVMVPTQTAALKWIREHGFNGAHCAYFSNEWGEAWIPAGIAPIVVETTFKTYEECAEYLILVCAKYLIN